MNQYQWGRPSIQSPSHIATRRSNFRIRTHFFFGTLFVIRNAFIREKPQKLVSFNILRIYYFFFIKVMADSRFTGNLDKFQLFGEKQTNVRPALAPSTVPFDTNVSKFQVLSRKSGRRISLLFQSTQGY